EYTVYGIYAQSMDIDFEILSNNGTGTEIELWLSMGQSGWERLSSMNDRLFWIEAIDPGFAPYMQPNQTGAFNGFNGMILYPTVNLGDYYVVQFGPRGEVLHVVDLNSMFNGIPCYKLVDDTGLATAYYRLSDKLLLYYKLANKTSQDRSTIMELWNEAVYTHPIIADFSTNDTTPNVGRVTQFIDMSINNGPGSFNYTVWTWNGGYGQGNYSGSTFNFFPEGTGMYEITLIVGTTAGNFNVKKVLYNVTLAPVALFSSNTTAITPGSFIQFNFTGSPGDTPATFSWDFGDGTAFSSDMDPIHQYTSLGFFTVTLNITDADGELDQLIMLNYIMVAADLFPVAYFEADATQVYIFQGVQFTFTGFPGDLPASYQWYFGDGMSNSTDLNPV
nr:PKD domain-containing protein [Candidatus Sigynarchaeota archaeon]